MGRSRFVPCGAKSWRPRRGGADDEGEGHGHDLDQKPVAGGGGRGAIAGNGGGGKAKLRPLGVKKAQWQLETLAEVSAASASPQKVAFLVLSGSFSPVHVGHLAAMEAAKDYVSKRAGIPVVAGFLAPHADAAGAGKAQDASLKADSAFLDVEVWTNLCVAACAESDWIDVCSWGWARSTRMVERMGKQLRDKLSSIAGVQWEFQAWWVVGNLAGLAAHLEEQLTPAVCVALGTEETFPCPALRSTRQGVNQLPSASTSGDPLRGTGHRAQRFRPAPVALVTRGRSHEQVDVARLRQLLERREFEELEALKWMPEPALRVLRERLTFSSAGNSVVSQVDAGCAPALPAFESDEKCKEDVRLSFRMSSTDSGASAAVAPPEQDEAGASLPGGIAYEPFVLEGAEAGSTCRPGRKGRVYQCSGDAAKASQCGGHKVIAHFCNDQGNGGRGFFQNIKSEYGQGPSRAYFEWHRDRAHSGFRLGAAQVVRVSKLVEVANMIAQQGSKSGSKGPSGRVDASAEALAAVCQHASEQDASVHIPWVGSSRAGLRLDDVMHMAKQASRQHGVMVYVYT